MRARAIAVFLAVISAGFACVHVAWALGWRGGVPSDQPSISHRPVFLTYDIVAAVLMYAAAVVAVLLGFDRVEPSRRHRLRQVTLVGAILALLRGVPALALDVITGDITTVGLSADLWFTVAGLAGLVLVREVRRVTHLSGSEAVRT